jgi:hypothetical protein
MNKAEHIPLGITPNKNITPEIIKISAFSLGKG